MSVVDIDYSGTSGVFTQEELEDAARRARHANELLHSGEGLGNEFLGWVNLPTSISYGELQRINDAARQLRKKAEVIISIGIGGSYLGAKAVIEALGEGFPGLPRQFPTVIFAGQNLSADYMYELLEAVKGYSLGVIVISKSGTTTEPAVAFRILKAELERRYGKRWAAKRIVAVTDAEKGALKAMADREGYPTFAIPDDVGGRYSVFTPAGLLPIACAGIDIEAFMSGAREMERCTYPDMKFSRESVERYAALRNLMYEKGFKIEILATYEPRLQYLAEWWKQLYGESEGKNGMGIFPASVSYTADLHSMGQYIQEGERIIFETVLEVENPVHDIMLDSDRDDLDGLNYLAGQLLSRVNRMAGVGVAIAHRAGGVPNLRISIHELTPFYLGALMYMFEKACGISGYMLGVNPFDQPGVEAYKTNMFALLGKPGYEEQAEAIKEMVEA